MKNALLVLCAILLVSAGVSAQNFGTQTVPGLGYTPNFSTYQIDGWYCTSWTPFTADSSKIQYSNPITTAIYDSVYCSGLATAPNNGAPNFFTTIEGSFDKTNWYDSLGIAVAICAATCKPVFARLCGVIVGMINLSAIIIS